MDTVRSYILTSFQMVARSFHICATYTETRGPIRNTMTLSDFHSCHPVSFVSHYITCTYLYTALSLCPPTRVDHNSKARIAHTITQIHSGFPAIIEPTVTNVFVIFSFRAPSLGDDIPIVSGLGLGLNRRFD